MKDISLLLAEMVLKLKSAQRALITMYLAVSTIAWMQIALFYPVLFEKSIWVIIGALLGYTTCLYVGALLGVGIMLILLFDLVKTEKDDSSPSYDGSDVWPSITGPIAYLVCFSMAGVEYGLNGYIFVKYQVYFGMGTLIIFVVAALLGYRKALRRNVLKGKD